MTTNQAIIKRIDDICKAKRSSVCEICLKAGMSPSALYDLVHGRTQYPKVITIQRFCEGAQITLGEFFNAQEFDNIDIDLD